MKFLLPLLAFFISLVSAQCEFEKVGDGSPHQSYFHRQVSDNMNCGSGGTGCSAIHAESHTFGYSVNVGFNVPYLSGGFSVDKSWTSGNNYGCNAGEGETTCVWVKTAYTAYTVQHKDTSPIPQPNCNKPPTKPFEMKSPNKNNNGGGYYCVAGSACRAQGQGYWE